MIGFCRNNQGGVPANFHNYFVAVFDRDFTSTHTWQNDTLNLNTLEAKSSRTGAVLGFKTSEDDKINVRVASSFISPEQAILNLEREIGDKDLEAIKEEGMKAWNDQLNRIVVEGGTLDQQRTFQIMKWSITALTTERYCQATCTPTTVSGIHSELFSRSQH